MHSVWKGIEVSWDELTRFGSTSSKSRLASNHSLKDHRHPKIPHHLGPSPPAANPSNPSPPPPQQRTPRRLTIPTHRAPGIEHPTPLLRCLRRLLLFYNTTNVSTPSSNPQSRWVGRSDIPFLASHAASLAFVYTIFPFGRVCVMNLGSVVGSWRIFWKPAGILVLVVLASFSFFFGRDLEGEVLVWGWYGGSGLDWKGWNGDRMGCLWAGARAAVMGFSGGGE